MRPGSRRLAEWMQFHGRRWGLYTTKNLFAASTFSNTKGAVRDSALLSVSTCIFGKGEGRQLNSVRRHQFAGRGAGRDSVSQTDVVAQPAPSFTHA
jgi:hypothetical protein